MTTTHHLTRRLLPLLSRPHPFTPSLLLTITPSLQHSSTRRWYNPQSTSASDIARASATKATTGITGIPVISNARDVCIDVLQRTLDKLKQYNQPESGYNKYCKELSEYRLSVMQKHTDAKQIQDYLAVGQIEEILIQAEKEYELCVAMNERDEFKALQVVDKETEQEWKHYADPMGANETLTLLTPEMLKAELESDECWKEIDAELDAEGVPPVKPFKADDKVLERYAKNIAI